VDPKAPALPEKESLTIGEVCRIVQVPTHTLRYWEEAGLLRPARRASGHRRYSRGDVETLFSLKELIQGRRMTLAGARKTLLERLRGKGTASEGSAALPPQALRLLREVRKDIQELVAELSR